LVIETRDDFLNLGIGQQRLCVGQLDDVSVSRRVTPSPQSHIFLRFPHIGGRRIGMLFGNPAAHRPRFGAVGAKALVLGVGPPRPVKAGKIELLLAAMSRAAGKIVVSSGS
jgi:hypothetical protein